LITYLRYYALVNVFKVKYSNCREMASAESISSNYEQIEHVTDKTDFCDNILSTHRSMPDKTVNFSHVALDKISFSYMLIA